ILGARRLPVEESAQLTSASDSAVLSSLVTEHGTQCPNYSGQFSLRTHDLADVLVRGGSLIPELLRMPTIEEDLAELPNEVPFGDPPAGFRPAQCPPRSVRAGAKRLRVAAPFDVKARRAHRARDDSALSQPRRDCPFAVNPEHAPIVHL